MSLSRPTAIFRPRQAKFDDTTPVLAPKNISAEEFEVIDVADAEKDEAEIPGQISVSKTVTSTVVELTKNDYYCISKLPALPSVLTRQRGHVLNGYSDPVSNYAVIVSEEGIFVWPYKSIDAAPLTIEFPLVDYTNGILPLAIITKPASGAIKDPGIVIINASSGLLRFYESVQHSPALGLINDKNLELTVSIKSDKGEFVTFAENVEPAGIVLVTSWKRVILVSLRDYKSKPSLSALELMSPVLKGITGLFNNSNEINEDIICIRSGNLYEHNTHQEIVIQESSGLVNIFTLHLATLSGSPQLDNSRTFSHHLNSYVESSLDGFNRISNITYLDIWQLNSTENTYLILCLVLDIDGDSLVLVTAKMDQSGVLVYGSHRSNRFKSEGSGRPRFFIPGPGSTAFIVINNSIIMTDIDYSYILSRGTVLYYKPRWEDVISFSSEVEIIGYGYENKLQDSNPAIILLTSNSGVIRVERFAESNVIPDEASLDPVSLVKSHIEQAIFYSSSSTAIDFNLSPEFNLNHPDAIATAVLKIVDEILHSTSQYLPQFLPTIGTLLEKKCKLFTNLLDYCSSNFPQLSSNVRLPIIHALEKAEVSLSIWNAADSGDKWSQKFQGILKTVIELKAGDSNRVIDGDCVRKYFNEDIDSINQVFTDVLSRIIDASLSTEFILDLVTKTLYDGILLIEHKYAADLTNKKSWIFDTDLILIVEGFFQRRYCRDTSSSAFNSHSIRANIGKLCHVLYFFINEAIDYMTIEGNEDLNNYVHWYNKNKISWVQCLLANNLHQEALTLVETYQDFTSLSQILEEDREAVLDQYGLHSVEYDGILAKYYVYFEKYQYLFAKSLFDFYIKHEKVQMLLTGFPRYKSLLDRYFDEESARKVASVAWIKKLIDNDFESASKFLLKANETHPDESQNSQELRYSLAKLSAIACKSDDARVTDLDGTLFQVETKLILIRIQKLLFQYISEALVKADRGDDVKFESFIKFLNDKIDQNTIRVVFQESFGRFVNNQTLLELVLIDYLTFVKPSSKFSNGFSNAFKVATLLPDEESYKYETKKIWCRLLAITDDWDKIRNTQNQSDEFVKRQIENSVLYKTMLSFNNNKEIKILEEMVNDDDSIFDEDNILISETNKSFFGIARNYIRTYNLLDWIQSLKAEVDLNI